MTETPPAIEPVVPPSPICRMPFREQARQKLNLRYPLSHNKNRPPRAVADRAVSDGDGSVAGEATWTAMYRPKLN